MGLRLDLRQIVYVLSDALDLVGVDDVFHGKRVAYMARCVGAGLGLGEPALDDLVHAGLFHDCGVSTLREHRSLVGSLDWGGEEEHCLRGQALVASFGPLAHLAPVIRWHHAHAQDHPRIDAPRDVLRDANLLYLVDRVDVQVAKFRDRDVLLARDDIRTVVRENRGTRFLADAVDAFLDLSVHEAFWLTLEPRALGPWLGRLARRAEARDLSIPELRQLAVVLATIVDAKSPFTAEHSLRVAAVARALARSAGLDEARSGLVEVAALLHDIGKMRVPEAVLDKPGPLDGDERVRITRHAFDTWQILSRIDGFDEIARWAAYHHEWVQGGGYPFGVGGSDLALEARIVAVSDVFQALRQDRPYRGRMPLAKVCAYIDAMTAEGKLDGDLVGLLYRDMGTYEALATAG
jgi:putative nucleotidyltransferase with HDIG domain